MPMQMAQSRLVRLTTRPRPRWSRSPRAGPPPSCSTLTGTSCRRRTPASSSRRSWPRIVSIRHSFGSDIDLPDGFPNFGGTSAAAPHAAGVAALLLQAMPSLTPTDVRNVLEATAQDIGPAGFDNNSGFGLIQAGAALNALHDFGIDSRAFRYPEPRDPVRDGEPQRHCQRQLRPHSDVRMDLDLHGRPSARRIRRRLIDDAHVDGAASTRPASRGAARSRSRSATATGSRGPARTRDRSCRAAAMISFDPRRRQWWARP